MRITVIAFRRPFFALFLALCICTAGFGQAIHSCTVIPETTTAKAVTPLSLPPGVQSAVSYNRNYSYDVKWRNGSQVTVRFLGGTVALRERVMRYAREWTRYANLEFKVVPSGRADIRISFVQNGASWSMVGSSSARADQNRASMNFGWLTDRTPEYEVKRTVLHEFGHALGLLHEHQNPAGGIPWDEDVVYDYYYRTQGWDQRTTYNNVMATADHTTTQYSAYDRASIMHYPISPRLTGGAYSVGMNNELSATDRTYIAKMYPGRTMRSEIPTSQPQTGTQPNRTQPMPPWPTDRPNVQAHRITINNVLGNNQRAETIRLYVAGKEHVIRLDRNGRTQDRLNLNLPPGKYNYQVTTRSTYFGYRNVRSNGRVFRKYVEQEVPGSGSGTLEVKGSANLTLFGNYDRQRRRMQVYLADSQRARK